MSLLIFVMPGMFAKRKDQLKKMFSLFPKNQDDNERYTFSWMLLRLMYKTCECYFRATTNELSLRHKI